MPPRVVPVSIVSDPDLHNACSLRLSAPGMNDPPCGWSRDPAFDLHEEDLPIGTDVERPI
jgi:hypothetical protein